MTASFTVAVPHASAKRSARTKASRQPLSPQPHVGPSGSIVWCPSSPAVPSWPRWIRPSIAITPPTPVPSVSPTIERAPRPAPSRSSASPKARASLMSATGRSTAVAIGSATGWSAHAPGMFTMNRVRPVAGSYRPGTPTPTDPIAGHRSAASRARSTMRPTTASGPPDAGVRTRPRSRTCQASDPRSMTAHLRFVPPRSMPKCCVPPEGAAPAVRSRESLGPVTGSDPCRPGGPPSGTSCDRGS